MSEQARLKVVIDREKWYRGKSGAGSRLLVRSDDPARDGKMCCLGFAALAAGFTEDEIRGYGTPAHLNLRDEIHPAFKGLTDESDRRACSEVCTDMMSINDRFHYDWHGDPFAPPSPEEDKLREAELIRLAGQIGMDFEFVN
jgi:hypothetical protein